MSYAVHGTRPTSSFSSKTTTAEDNGRRREKKVPISLSNFLESDSSKIGSNRTAMTHTTAMSTDDTVCASILSIQSYATELDAMADLKLAEFMADAAESARNCSDDEYSEFSDLEENVDFDDMTCEFLNFLSEKENTSSTGANIAETHREKPSGIRCQKKALESLRKEEHSASREMGDLITNLPKTPLHVVEKGSNFGDTNRTPVRTQKSFGFNSVTPKAGHTPSHGKSFSAPTTPRSALTPRNGKILSSPAASTQKGGIAFPTTPMGNLSPCKENQFPTNPTSLEQSDECEHPASAQSSPCSKRSAEDSIIGVPGDDIVISQSQPGTPPSCDENIDDGASSFSSDELNPKRNKGEENEYPIPIVARPGRPVFHDENDETDPCMRAYRVWRAKGLMKNTFATKERTRKRRKSGISYADRGRSPTPVQKRPASLDRNSGRLALTKKEEESTGADENNTSPSKPLISQLGRPVVYDESDEKDPCTKAYRVWRAKGLMRSQNKSEICEKTAHPRMIASPVGESVTVVLSEESSLTPANAASPARKSASLAAEKVAARMGKEEKVLYSDPANCTSQSRLSKSQKTGDISFSSLLKSWRDRRSIEYQLLPGGILSPLKQNRKKCSLKEWNKTDASDQKSKGESHCLCSDPAFSVNDDLVEFFLPNLGMASCTCGKQDKIFDKNEPTSLANILRPWQVEFLHTFGIRRGDQLVKANHRSAGALAKAMRVWRKQRNMVGVRTVSCGMALHIWSQTCKVFVRTIRRRKRKKLELKPPSMLDILSTFLGKVAVPDERRLSRRYSSRLSIESTATVEI